MSDDLAAIHKQTSAIFEKLYDEKNQPEQLDEAFIQEYFKRVQDALNLDVEEDPLKGPRPTEAMLSHPDSGLIDVLIKSKVEKFVVSALASVKTLDGVSQRIGKDRGDGKYVMSTVKIFPHITIKSSKGYVFFIGLPNKVQTESGRGKWEKA